MNGVVLVVPMLGEPAFPPVAYAMRFMLVVPDGVTMMALLPPPPPPPPVPSPVELPPPPPPTIS